MKKQTYKIGMSLGYVDEETHEPISAVVYKTINREAPSFEDALCEASEEIGETLQVWTDQGIGEGFAMELFDLTITEGKTAWKLHRESAPEILEVA